MNIMTKQGSLDNIVTYEHICDTTADMNNIDPHYITLGSVCIVINEEGEGMEVYMANSNKEWIPIATNGGGSSVIVSPLSITTNGTYTAPSGEAYSPITVNIDESSIVRPKAINFYDFDGTVVYSYSADEFATLSAMPDNPDHSEDEIPLTSQGWNWTLNDAKAYVAKYGMLEIGQMYTPTDGNMHVMMHMDEDLEAGSNYLRVTILFGVDTNTTATIDWGDESSPDIEEVSEGAYRWYIHDYPHGGDFHITIHLASGNIAFSYIDDRIKFVGNRPYNQITRIHIPNGVTRIELDAFKESYGLRNITLPSSITYIGESAFESCFNLESITIPDNVDEIDYYAFKDCGLNSLSLPNSVINIRDDAFSGNHMTNLTMPDSISTISLGAFSNCPNLTNVIISDSIDTISDEAFNNCYSLKHVEGLNNVAYIDENAFNYCYGLISKWNYQ